VFASPKTVVGATMYIDNNGSSTTSNSLIGLSTHHQFSREIALTRCLQDGTCHSTGSASTDRYSSPSVEGTYFRTYRWFSRNPHISRGSLQPEATWFLLVYTQRTPAEMDESSLPSVVGVAPLPS
jgi:hypothetical protein